MESRNPDALSKYKDYLIELKEFSKLRKRNVFDYEKRYQSKFNYDFKKLMEKEFVGLPEKLKEPITVEFYTKDDTKSMIKVQIKERGSDVDGIGKILSRTLGSMLLRDAKFEKMDRKETEKEKLVKEIEILEKDVGVNQSPGEFV